VKRAAGFFLLSLLLLFLQVAVLPRLLPDHLKPDLLLLVVAYLGLTRNWLRGGLCSWYLGSLEDVFAGSDFGLFGITFLLIFLLVKTGAGRFNTESPLLLLLLAFFVTMVKGVLLSALLLLFADAGRQWPLLLHVLLPEALLNTLFALLFLRCLPRRRAERRGGLSSLSRGLSL
jgi:rod shape-determining protein MreD